MQKIRRIIINNFRQYKDVTLEVENENGVFVFVARNGAGKSNFLNAICWCLYEEEPFVSSDERSPLLNEDIARENPYAPVSVSIEVLFDDNTILFSRTKREGQLSDLKVKRKIGEDWVDFPDPETIVENFLPRDLMSFFLFDGESVQNLFRGNYSEKLKDSVWKVSNVQLLDNAISHLRNVKKEISLRIGNENTLVDDARRELETLEERIQKSKEELVSSKQIKKESEEKKIKFRKKSDDIKLFKKETELRKLLEEENERLVSEINKENLEINELLTSEGLNVFLYDALINSADAIRKIKIKGELPPKIKPIFISELIGSKDPCICGRPIGDTEIKYLQKILEDSASIDKRAFLQEEYYQILPLIEQLKIVPNKLLGLMRRKSEKESEKEENDKKLNNISEKLRNIEVNEISKIENFIKLLEDNIESNAIKISHIQDDLNMLEEEKSSADLNLKKLIEQDKKNIIEKSKIDFIDKNIIKIESIRDRVIDSVRRVVSNNADDYFKELVWKKETFEEIRFDENYKVTILKRNFKKNSLEELGMGETKVLGFATIKALTSISGFEEAPVFIDGALEYLDPGVQKSFLSSLPSFLPNKQLFIFFPDRKEIKEFVIEHVKPNNYYEIIYNESEHATEIRRGYGN